MPSIAISEHMFFEDPLRLYNQMLDDIESAKKYIYIETYRFRNDAIGMRFRDALVKKAKEGVKIKLLLDSWGTSLPDSFFDELIQHGGEVRFFKKLKLFFDWFTKNHRRNHRKITLIDDEISYLGSANIAAHSVHWRELVIRMKGSMALTLKKCFQDSYELFKKYSFKKLAQKKIIHYQGFEIIQDIPSVYRQKIKRRYEQLILSAKKEVVIETPYFLPGFKLRKAMMETAMKGVDVVVIMPYNSDVRLVDVLRGKYLGMLHENKVKLLFYKPTNLHAKCLMVDKEIFVIGTANFDYRSFRYQYEIALLGDDKNITQSMINHIEESLKDCIPFDYEKWQRRPLIQKLFEHLLLPIRHLL